MANDNTLTKPAADEAASAEHTREGRYYRPHVDILEKDEELIVLADVPGASGEQIDVQFEDGTLTIHAKVDRRQDESTEYLLGEYGIGDFYRTFQVSEAIDVAKITAEYTDGVLTLHLPKTEATRPRKIGVNAQ